MITTTASSYKSCDLQELKMAGKQNIVPSWLESWLEVLARVLACSPGSTPGSSPGSVYGHPRFGRAKNTSLRKLIFVSFKMAVAIWNVDWITEREPSRWIRRENPDISQKWKQLNVDSWILRAETVLRELILKLNPGCCNCSNVLKSQQYLCTTGCYLRWNMPLLEQNDSP